MINFFYSLHQKLKTDRKYLLLHYQIKLYLIVVSYFSEYSIRGLNGLQQWRIKLIYFSMLMYFEKNHCFLLFFQHAHWALKNSLEQHRSIFPTLMYFEKNHCFLSFFKSDHWALKNDLELFILQYQLHFLDDFDESQYSSIVPSLPLN